MQKNPFILQFINFVNSVFNKLWWRMAEQHVGKTAHTGVRTTQGRALSFWSGGTTVLSTRAVRLRRRP